MNMCFHSPSIDDVLGDLAGSAPLASHPCDLESMPDHNHCHTKTLTITIQFTVVKPFSNHSRLTWEPSHVTSRDLFFLPRNAHSTQSVSPQRQLRRVHERPRLHKCRALHGIHRPRCLGDKTGAYSVLKLRISDSEMRSIISANPVVPGGARQRRHAAQ